jgi:hypothetical protein
MGSLIPVDLFYKPPLLLVLLPPSNPSGILSLFKIFKLLIKKYMKGEFQINPVAMPGKAADRVFSRAT